MVDQPSQPSPLDELDKIMAVEKNRLGSAQDRDSGADLNQLIASIDQVNAPLRLDPILSERAKNVTVGERYIRFMVGGALCAFSIDHMVELSTVPELSFVPGVPQWMTGVTQVRGEVVAIIDLRHFLGVSPSEQVGKARLLLVKAGQEDLSAGLVVDEVMGQVQFSASELHQPNLPLDERLHPFLRGVYSGDERLLVVWDLEKFLFSSEIRELAAARS